MPDRSAPRHRAVLLFALLPAACAASPPAQVPPAAASPPTAAAPSANGSLPAADATCRMADAAPALSRWLAAWELASRELLHLAPAPAPELVFFDEHCVYTTSAVSAGGLPPVAGGPTLFGVPLPWRALAHHGAVVSPKGDALPIGLTSFASVAPSSGPFFVMSAPALWAARLTGPDPGLAVFLHEFAHTRQVGGFGDRLGPLDASWPFPEELDDDAVQTHLEGDPAYVAEYLAERDLLYAAADAASQEEARARAAEVLARMKARHARWLTGERAALATADDVFLAMEGAGQWTAYAWLADPRGGGLGRRAAIERMLGKRRRWSQDEGLALFLAVDRLLPAWPKLAFGIPAAGALELLARAVEPEGPAVAAGEGRRSGTYGTRKRRLQP